MKVYSDETIRQSLVTANSKQQLHQWHQQIKTYLEQLRLKIHPRKANLFVVKRGVDILGYRVFPHYRLLRNDNGHRFTRKLRRFARLYAQGEMEYEDFNPSVQSWIGHAAQADTEGLRSAIFNQVVFRRRNIS